MGGPEIVDWILACIVKSESIVCLLCLSLPSDFFSRTELVKAERQSSEAPKCGLLIGEHEEEEEEEEEMVEEITEGIKDNSSKTSLQSTIQSAVTPESAQKTETASALPSGNLATILWFGENTLGFLGLI